MILLILFSLSCDQTTLGIGTAVKNLVTYPVKAVKNVLSDKEYSKIERRTLKEDEVDLSEIRCSQENTNPQLNQVETLRDNVRALACKCIPWGTCSKEECECDILCPNNFNIFKRREIHENTKSENSLAFRNSPGVSENYEMTNGFCWGHASLTSKFNRLAFFKNDKPAPFNINSENEQEQNNAIAYYKKKIDAVINNEAVDIEGFSNLKEFSDHPALQSYLGDMMAEQWADNAMTFQGLHVGLSSKAFPRKRIKRFLRKVKRKIDSNQQPQIVFTGAGKSFDTHTVLISHYQEKENGELILCVRDNNEMPDSNSVCENKMYIDDSGKLQYENPDWGEIGGFKIAHNDNPDAVEQFEALKEKCNNDKDCKQ